jgi:acyl-CoA thioester hydrolase
MRFPNIPLEAIRTLPLIYTEVVPKDYEDENGHMNVRHYMSVFDDAGYNYLTLIGLSLEYHEENGTGGFDLEHHLHYLNEVLIGDTVSVYIRFVGCSPKRTHYIMFMVNETRGKLAATFECVNSFANLVERKTAPFPDDIYKNIQHWVNQHQALTWDAPACGVMSA